MSILTEHPTNLQPGHLQPEKLLTLREEVIKDPINPSHGMNFFNYNTTTPSLLTKEIIETFKNYNLPTDTIVTSSARGDKEIQFTAIHKTGNGSVVKNIYLGVVDRPPPKPVLIENPNYGSGLPSNATKPVLIENPNYGSVL